MVGFLITSVVIAAVFLTMVRVSIGLDTDSKRSAVVAALIVALLNGALLPILEYTAIPVTLLSYGLAAIVLNTLFLYLTAAVVRGFHVRGCVNGLIAGIVLGLVTTSIYGILVWIGL